MKVRNLDSEPYKGIAKRDGRYISTGTPSIDYALNDLAPGCLTLILGRMNCGKTTFVKQIIANAINTDNKVFVINGEGDTETFINELYKCVIGRHEENYEVVRINKRFHKEPKPEILAALQRWHYNKFSMLNKSDADLNSTDELFKIIDNEIKINKPDLIIIDNLMSVLSANANEKNEKQSDFVQKCHDLAVVNRTHIILVLHPNKEFRAGMDMEVEFASGTSDMGNKADNVIAITREYDEDKIALGVNGQIAVLKNRYYPDLKKIDTTYEESTGLLLENTQEGSIAYKFSLCKYTEIIEDDKIMLPFDL